MKNYYTKEQSLMLIEKMGFKDPLPKKGMALWLVFPVPNQPVKVTKSEMKSTYGKPLYQFEWVKQL